MKTTYVLLMIIASAVTQSFGQSSLTNPQAINIAGRERMLVQRLAKDKVYQSMNVLTMEVNKEMSSSIILFEENLKLLTEYATTNELKSKINALSVIWMGYKESILSKNSESTKNVFKFNNIILASCEDLVKELILMSNSDINDTSSTYSQLANSGKLRYLSQRFALYYATYYYKIDSPNTSDLNNILKEFDMSLTNLMVSKNKTSQTDEHLNEIIKVWKELKDPLAKDKNTGFDFTRPDLPNPEKVFNNCNTLLVNADKLFGIYLTSIASTSPMASK